MALRFTRFSNPHNGIHETQAAFSLSQNEGHETAEQHQIKHEAIRKFEQYFEDNIVLDQPPRKRFKGERQNIHEQPKLFRLVSSRLPPQPIALEAPLIHVRSCSPAIQDTSEQRHVRRVQARQAAVEVHEINAESSYTARDKPVSRFSTSSSLEPAVALVVHDDEPKDTKAKVSIIQVASNSPEIPLKRKRRRFKAKPPRPRPTFFRPDMSMGPHATGYALGYPGSWMVEDPSKTPYQKDKMKWGRMADLLHHHRAKR